MEGAGLAKTLGLGRGLESCSSLSSLSLKNTFFLVAAFLATVVTGLSAKLEWSTLPSTVTPPAVLFYTFGRRGGPEDDPGAL